MKIGDLVRLKYPKGLEKNLVGVITHIDDWRPVGKVYWNNESANAVATHVEGCNIYLRDVELVKQAKTKAV
jgi:hypothetical protein